MWNNTDQLSSKVLLIRTGLLLINHICRLSVGFASCSTFGHYSQLLQPKLWRLTALVICLSAIGGCQSFSYQTLVDKQVLATEIRQSRPFQHRLFTPLKAPISNTDDNLHIYIEGDGVPWISRYFIAQDPTPEYGLMLDAMLRDTASSVYLGRPCYYHTEDTACHAEYWTMGRYSEAVVDSMVKMVEKLAEGKEDIWLIGHSGGGTLATLIGRRLSRQVNVLTIAANLDHFGWTEHHNYTPLKSSINVVGDQTRNPNMQEYHWFGDADKNVVPLWTTLNYCQQQKTYCQLAKAKHGGGWLSQWPQILRQGQQYFLSAK